MPATLTSGLTKIGEIVELRHADIEPDPKQPRSDADAALRASIEANGIHQPIVVRPHPAKPGKWILEDGERRWRGAAGVLDVVPARIDTRDLSRAELLIIQATYNKSKPLPPFDEAGLYRALHNHGMSDQEIARRLDVPRSTVGERRRMLELPAPWVELIRDGKLGISHAPIIQRYAPIPAKYHGAIAKATMAGLREDRPPGEEPTRADFERALWDAADEYLTPLEAESQRWNERFDPKLYKGPIVELGDRWNPRGEARHKYAAEPEQWKPLVDAAEKERTKREARSSSSDKAYQARYEADNRRKAAALKNKNALRRAQFAAIAERLPTVLDQDWLLFSVRWLVREMHSDTLRLACKQLGLEVGKRQYGYDYHSPIVKHGEQLGADGRARLILQLLLTPDASVGPYDAGSAERFQAAAKLLKLDLAKVKVEDEKKPAAANGKKPSKWARRNKRGSAKHAPETVAAAADVEDDDAGFGDGTRDDLWDSPEDHDGDDVDEDLVDEALEEEAETEGSVR